MYEDKGYPRFIIKQRDMEKVISKCKGFFDKWKDKPEMFFREYPEEQSRFMKHLGLKKYKNFNWKLVGNYIFFRDWLFEQIFGGV